MMSFLRNISIILNNILHKTGSPLPEMPANLVFKYLHIIDVVIITYKRITYKPVNLAIKKP